MQKKGEESESCTNKNSKNRTLPKHKVDRNGGSPDINKTMIEARVKAEYHQEKQRIRQLQKIMAIG